METLKLFTIGFTRKPAETFFRLLGDAGVKRVLDIRLNNVSQLAGFAKRDDLRFFLKAVGGMDYLHLPELAPTQEILDAYRKSKTGWPAYEAQFLDLLSRRQVEKTVPRDLLHYGCLLCSEEAPDHCHRRLVAEYLLAQWGGIEITHLL
jgi:uncharacterized protein (DUF488 family)